VKSIQAALIGALALVLVMPTVAAAQADDGVPDILTAVESTIGMETVGISGLVTLHAPGNDPESMVMMDAGGQVDFGAARRVWLEGEFIELGGLSVIFDGNDAYLGGDGFEDLVPAGSLIYINMDSPPPALADLATEFMIGNDAALALYWLLGADGPMEVVGHEDVGGVDTVHVRIPIDLELVEAQVPSTLLTVYTENLAEMRASGADIDHGEAWIDGDGMIRRAAYEMQAGTPAQPLVLSIVYEFSDFGAPIDLPIPGPEYIIDAWELFE
jgi:hypothetical protein